MSEPNKQHSVQECQRHLRFWTKQLEILGVNASTVNAKETEAEKRDIPPTPPIERKGEEKERSYHIRSYPRARARDCDAGLSKDERHLLFTSPLPEHRELLRNYTAPCPTLARAVAHARLRGFNDETFVTKWYDCMEMSC